jgi:hypothetical protein
MSNQFCKTFGDGLFFSSLFRFGSWQTTTNDKEKYQTVGILTL